MVSSTTVLQLIAAGQSSLDELEAATGASRDRLVKSVQTLKKRGLVHTCDALDKAFGSLAIGVYALTEAGREAAERGDEIRPGKAGARPRKKTAGLRERAWWHLRAHRVTTLRELLSTHACGNEKAAHINLYKYLIALEKAGILRRLDRKQPARQSKGWVVWSLANDVGPQPPVWRQTARQVYDPNGGGVVSIAEEVRHEQG